MIQNIRAWWVQNVEPELTRLWGMRVALITLAIGSMDQFVPSLQGRVSPLLYVALTIAAAVLPGVMKK